jgi:hypothetical protein
MSASSKSRQLLSVGTIFFHREFECNDGTVKDRYFVVVGSDETSFHCLTTSTQEYLRATARFSTETSCIIDAGTTALPKTCVVDCRFLYAFDDIIMSNRLSTGRASVVGQLPNEYLESVYEGVKSSRVLETKKKAPVLGTLAYALGVEVKK